MADLTAHFTADFSSFKTAVDQSVTKLKSFQTDANKVAASLGRIGDSFSGRKILQEATLAAKAVNDIGGATSLTEKEQARLNATVTEAIAKYTALGQKAPDELVKIQKETAKQTSLFGQVTQALGPLGTTIAAAFSVEKILTFGRELIHTAATFDTLAKSAGVSTRDIQAFTIVFRDVGLEGEQAAQAVERLSANIAAGGSNSAKTAVDQLGLSVAKLRSAGPRELFLQVAEAVDKIENPITKARIAADLWGDRVARTLIPALGNIRAKIEEAEKSNEIFTDQTIKDAKRFEDIVQHMWHVFEASAANALDAASRAWKIFITATQFSTPLNLGGLTDGTGAGAASQAVKPEASHRTTQEAISDADLLKNHIKALKAEALTPLSDSVKKQILELQTWGESLSQIAIDVDKPEAAVFRFVEANKAATAAAKEAGAADRERTKQLAEISLGIESAYLAQLRWTDILDEWGKKASDAITLATTYGKAVDDSTAAVARAYQLQEAHKAEQVGAGVPALGGVTENTQANGQFYDALFKARDAAETQAITHSNDRNVAAAELALELDKQRAASHAQLFADTEAVERAITQGKIAQENERFKIATAGLHKEEELYQTLEAAHQETVNGIAADWQDGVNKRLAAEKTFTNSVLQNLAQVKDSIARILTDAFTGGGGLIGALKGIAVQLANAFIEPFIDTIIKALAKGAIKRAITEQVSGIAGGVGGGGGGGSLLNSAGSVAAQRLLFGGGAGVAGSVGAGSVGSFGGFAISNSAPSIGAVTAPTGAGGGLGFLSNPAFYTNPYTIGVTAAVVGGYLLYRHLHQGPAANDVRDQFQAQFGHAGSGSGSGFRRLADMLHRIGDDGLFDQLQKANSPSKVRTAEALIIADLSRHNLNKGIKSFQDGGFVPPGVVQPAILHGGRFGERIISGNRQTQGPALNQTSVIINVSAVDAAGFDRVWKERIVPQLKLELLTNQLGTVTAINRVVAKA